MSLNKIKSRSPVVKAEELDLVEMITSHSTLFVPFKKKIIWIRECEAAVSLWHGGHPIKSIGTYTDFYGYMSSLATAKEDAAELASRHSISDKSSLEIRIDLTINDVPVLEVPEDRLDWLDKESVRASYYEIPNEYLWLRNDPEVIKTYEKMVSLLSKKDPKYHVKEWELRNDLLALKIKKNILMDSKLAWSSQTGDTGVEIPFLNPSNNNPKT
jgi:hypothetical protein